MNRLCIPQRIALYRRPSELPGAIPGNDLRTEAMEERAAIDGRRYGSLSDLRTADEGLVAAQE